MDLLFIFSFILYLVFTLHAKTAKINWRPFDFFSNKIMLVYLIGFLIKAILWLAVAIDNELEQDQLSDDNHFSLPEFIQNIFEDIVNLFF